MKVWYLLRHSSFFQVKDLANIMDLSIYMISLDTSLSGQSYLLQSTGYGDKLFFI